MYIEIKNFMRGARRKRIAAILLLLNLVSIVCYAQIDDNTLLIIKERLDKRADNKFLFDLTGNKSLNSPGKLTAERMLKSNLNMLSRMADGEYMNNFHTLEDIFAQIDRFPEEIKNKMFLWAVGGGIVREAMSYSRKQLAKHKIGFVYPNIYGLNFSYYLSPIRASFHFRARSQTDRYYALYLKKGTYAISYNEMVYGKQIGISYRYSPKYNFFASNSVYGSTLYYGFGVLARAKKYYFYFNYLKNTTFADGDRFDVFLNVDMN
jgi:hypothetical protein